MSRFSLLARGFCFGLCFELDDALVPVLLFEIMVCGLTHPRCCLRRRGDGSGERRRDDDGGCWRRIGRCGGRSRRGDDDGCGRGGDGFADRAVGVGGADGFVDLLHGCLELLLGRLVFFGIMLVDDFLDELSVGLWESVTLEADV
jgi:hypothetical protein